VLGPYWQSYFFFFDARYELLRPAPTIDPCKSFRPHELSLFFAPPIKGPGPFFVSTSFRKNSQDCSAVTVPQRTPSFLLPPCPTGLFYSRGLLAGSVLFFGFCFLLPRFNLFTPPQLLSEIVTRLRRTGFLVSMCQAQCKNSPSNSCKFPMGCREAPVGTFRSPSREHQLLFALVSSL